LHDSRIISTHFVFVETGSSSIIGLGEKMRKFALTALATLLLLATLVPAQAGTWRSTTGNMFHFYPGGSMNAYIQGGSYGGSWWWTNNPYQFQYSIHGLNGYGTVNIQGQGAICSVPGQHPQYWTQIASRGEEDNKPDVNSWFMTTVSP
jgi:hypothetical protein